MAEETCMKDVRDHEDVSLSYLKILSFVKIKHICFEISSLGLTVSLPDLSQEPVSERFDRNDDPLDLLNRIDQSENKTCCKSCNVIIKNEAD